MSLSREFLVNKHWKIYNIINRIEGIEMSINMVNSGQKLHDFLVTLG
jgi:hypothetical protein